MSSSPTRSRATPQLVVLPGRPFASADDATLARSVADGEPVAATVLWDRFSPLIRGMLRRSLGPDHDVEDLLQESFLGVFKQIKTLREPTLLRSFVIGVAVRTVGTELRRRRVRSFLRLTRDGVMPEPGQAPTDHEARQALRDLYAILDGLRPEARMLFVLRHFESMELTDVAAAMGISLATTKRRLLRVTDQVMARVKKNPGLAHYVGHTHEGGLPE